MIYQNKLLKLTKTGTSQFYISGQESLLKYSKYLDILYMNCMSIAPLPTRLIWVASREKSIGIFQVFTIGMQKLMILSNPVN